MPEAVSLQRPMQAFDGEESICARMLVNRIALKFLRFLCLVKTSNAGLRADICSFPRIHSVANTQFERRIGLQKDI